jgi:hypothetical protein
MGGQAEFGRRAAHESGRQIQVRDPLPARLRREQPQPQIPPLSTLVFEIELLAINGSTN